MKILYICPTSEFYGDGKAILNIMPYLVSSGVEPLFLVPKEGEFTKQLKKYGYNYFTVGIGMWKTFKGEISLYMHLKFAIIRLKEYMRYLQLKKFVKRWSPDIIHTNNSTTNMGYQLSKDLRIKHIWHVREYGLLDHGWTHYPSKDYFEKQLNARNNYSIVITDDIYNYLNKPLKSKVIYDGVITNDTIPEINGNNKDFFLFVGRLSEPKGIMEVLISYLDYCANVAKPLKLKIAGTGPCMDKINYMIRENSNIELLGYCNNIPELMSEARALIIASKCEAFGFITTEALFNGCIVIGKDTGGTKMQFDKVNNDKTCIRYINVQDLSNKLVDISSLDITLLQSEKIESQKRVLNLFSAKVSANQVFNFYQTIIE